MELTDAVRPVLAPPPPHLIPNPGTILTKADGSVAGKVRAPEGAPLVS